MSRVDDAIPWRCRIEDVEARMRRWADLRRACLAMRRAALRGAHPRWSKERIANEMRRDLDRAWHAKLDDYQRNG